MDYQTIAQLGIACAIAVGAKREMNSFRDMFKATLDKLADRVNSESEHIERLSARMGAVELAVQTIAEAIDESNAEEGGVLRGRAGFKPAIEL